MAQKIGLTVADVDGQGDYTPHTGLGQSAFTFVKASDNVTVVTFTGFTEVGNGNYTFSGFNVPEYEPENPTFAREQVKVKINGTLQNGYGVITVYSDDDEPAGASYSVGRVDREGDTIFYWLTYVPDAGHEPPFDPYDPNTAAEPDNVLVCNKYVKDNFGELAQSNTWTGSTNQFEAALFHDVVYHEDIVTGQDFEMEPLSDLYLGVDEPTNTTLIWKKWADENYGVNASGWTIQGNELYVDKNLTANVVGKKYNNVNTAIAFAQTQSPSTINRWKIYIMPYMIGASTGYTDNITLYPNIDLIGVGQVKLSCSVTLSGTWTGVPKSFWQNIDFERINVNQTLQGISFTNCNLYNWNLSATHTLTLTTCQLKNTGLYVVQVSGTGTIASGTGNRVIGCYGNYDVVWDSTDKIYSYNFINDLTEIFFNGTSY